MSTKVILNATGVHALLEQDPGFFGELAKHAAAQVAEEFARRTIKLDIKAHVDREFRNAFGHEWQGWNLSAAVKTAIERSAAKAVADQLVLQTDALVRKELFKRVDEATKSFEEKLETSLDARLEAAVKRVLARGIR